MTRTESLRVLPSVDEVLRCAATNQMLDACPRQQVTRWIREAIDTCRTTLLSGTPMDADAAMQFVLHRVRERSRAELGESLQHVINATGILLHTNLGRSPLAAAAMDKIQHAAAYTNVELNLDTGKRSQRGERVTRLLCELTGSEAAVVVNNCAAATMLVLQALSFQKEVVISRGQLVEIGGGFRLPDVFAAAGVKLREIGTTNRTYLADYEAALSEETGAIIRVHRSNFQQVGFVTEPTIRELVSITRSRHVPVIDDIGSGCIHDLSAFGLREATVKESVTAGADVILFSGDKLFGGPQCGIILGGTEWIRKIRQSPMMRAVRVDKLTLAALEATTEIHLSGQAADEIPFLRMVSRDAASIRSQCQTVANGLSTTSLDISVVPCESQVGGGSIPGSSLRSFGLRISGEGIERLSHRLRTGRPAVIGRLSDDCLILDLRTVAEHETETLAAQLNAAAQST